MCAMTVRMLVTSVMVVYATRLAMAVMRSAVVVRPATIVLLVVLLHIRVIHVFW